MPCPPIQALESSCILCTIRVMSCHVTSCRVVSCTTVFVVVHMLFHLRCLFKSNFFLLFGTETGTRPQQRHTTAMQGGGGGNGGNSDVNVASFKPSSTSSSPHVLHQRHWKGRDKSSPAANLAITNFLFTNSDGTEADADASAEGDDDELEKEEEEDDINYQSDDDSSSSSSGFIRWPPESYFDLEASSDVTVVVGQAAFLVCRVAVAGNWTVSLSNLQLTVRSCLFVFLLSCCRL